VGGIAANSVALVAFAAVAAVKHSISLNLLIFMACNAYCILISAIPSTFKSGATSHRTDGGLIKAIVADKRLESESYYDLAAYRAHIRQMQEIGDREQTFFGLVTLLTMYLFLGDRDGAASAFDEASIIYDHHDPWDSGHIANARAQLQLIDNPHGAIESAIESERLFLSGGYEAASVWARLARKLAYKEAGLAEMSAKTLTALLQTDLIQNEPHFIPIIMRMQADDFLTLGKIDDALKKAEDLWTLNEDSSYIVSYHVFIRIAAALGNDGRYAEATRFYQRALTQMHKIFKMQSDLLDRSLFALNHQKDIDQASAYFRKIDDEAGALKAEALFEQEEQEPAQRPGKADSTRRDRYNSASGMYQGITFGFSTNALIAFATWQSAKFGSTDFMSILCYSSVVGLILQILLLAGRSRAWIIAYGGYAGVALAIIPWIAALIAS